MLGTTPNILCDPCFTSFHIFRRMFFQPRFRKRFSDHFFQPTSVSLRKVFFFDLFCGFTFIWQSQTSHISPCQNCKKKVKLTIEPSSCPSSNDLMHTSSSPNPKRGLNLEYSRFRANPTNACASLDPRNYRETCTLLHRMLQEYYEHCSKLIPGVTISTG